MENRITTGTFIALACSAVLAYAAPQSRPHGGTPVRAQTARVSHEHQQSRMTTVEGCPALVSSPKKSQADEPPLTSQRASRTTHPRSSC